MTTYCALPHACFRPSLSEICNNTTREISSRDTVLDTLLGMACYKGAAECGNLAGDFKGRVTLEGTFLGVAPGNVHSEGGQGNKDREVNVREVLHKTRKRQFCARL